MLLLMGSTCLAVVALVCGCWFLPSAAALSARTFIQVKAAPATRPTTSSQSLAMSSHTYYTIIDGPGWESLRESPLIDENASPAGSSLPVVIGTLESTEEPVVALLAINKDGGDDDDDDNEATVKLSTGQVVWKESVARYPSTASAAQVAATFVMALTHLYPLAAAQIPAVGGSQTTFSGVSVPKGTVVVLGGNPEAVWAAKALAKLGSHVTLVSAKKPSVEGVTVVSSNDSFSEKIGKFDAVLDTVGSETPSSRTVSLLASQHGCRIYRSTRTRADEIVASEGLLFGPGKAKDYFKRLADRKMTVATTLPVAGWGALVEELFQANLWAPASDSLQTVNKSDKTTTWVRGWSLKAAWETNTWPSNTDGTRYGFPTLDDMEEEEEDDMVVSTAKLQSNIQIAASTATEEAESTGSRYRASSSSPYIVQVYGEEGLEKEIVEPELDCILFMAAPFCRTCQKLRAPYARLARLNFEDENSDIVFAKADIVGKFGKALGKSLGVNTVPTFMLFRKGERFGKPLNISKLPHPQLDLALKYLKERTEWDDDQFSSDGPNRQTKI